MMVKNQIRQRARLERHYYDVERVACIPGQIGQVVVNLLVNAIHAIREGDVHRNVILVRIKPFAEEQVAIEVLDTGCGIPPELIGRIMEPFFTTKPAGQGTGLGLAISANVVEQHGGRIEVESTVDKGTLARVVLPIAGKLKLKRPAEAQAAVRPGDRCRVLVVDDEVYLLNALRRSLGRVHEVLVASSAEQALALLDRDPAVDVVLVDMMMPDVDGVELYERIVERMPQLASRFVFMTGGVFTERVRSFLQRTQIDVLSKPIKRDELQRAIAALGRDRDRR
jgi:CheY-like chemotaxis protein